ncbi:MAG: CRTAC1 family protein, partial [Saprospiraceae bacterium]|nr:CRTAC1 family protein [Saprospiraceae bacterium]
MKSLRYFLPAIFAFVLIAACKQEQGDAADSQPSAPPSDLHFELLKAEATGIGFANTIKETFTDNIITNSYLYNGGGVAILDVNNDELPDVYFTATQGPNRLYLNKGNFQFEDITDKAGVASMGGLKTGVTVVDINGDGFQDIYVCRTGSEPGPNRTNLLYVNNGNSTFTESAGSYGLADQSASNHANFFDYDLDGDLDVYVLNHPLAWQEVNRVRLNQQAPTANGFARLTTPKDQYESDRLYRNEGNGKFTDVSQQMGINNRAWGLSVTVSDFNNDGYPDLYIGNDYIEPDMLYINQKGQGFKDEIWAYFRHISNHTMGVDIADFNNDGLIDVTSLDMVAEDNQRQKELMTTMIQDRYQSLIKYGYGNQHMRNMLQLNTGAAPGTGACFSEIGQLAGVNATDWSWSPLFADFDNDGFKDLYITNGYRRDVTNLDYLTYTVDSVMRAGGLTSKNFKTIDEYLAKIPTKPLQNYMFKNKDGLNFQNVGYDWGLGDLSYSNGSAYADFDKDGDLDLVINQIDGQALVYKNKSAERQGANWLQVKLKGSAQNPNGLGAKLRIQYGGNIQYLEMTANHGFFSVSEALLHFGLGAVQSVDKLEIRWPNGLVQKLENQPVNQRLLLKIEDAKPGKWDALPSPAPLFQAVNNGIDFKHQDDDFNDYARERLLPHAFSNLGPNISVGDVNGDGLEDFYVGGARDQAGALYFQQSGGNFVRSNQTAFEADKLYEDMGSTFFDADNDNDLDLYVVSGGSTYDANSSNYQDRLYVNVGKGVFGKANDGVLPREGNSGSCVAANDFDKDGDQYLVGGGLVVPGRYPPAPPTM